MPLVRGEGTETSPPPSQHGSTTSSWRTWWMMRPWVQLGALTGQLWCRGAVQLGTALQAPG